jgi:PAS domain S-box-containing protein
MRSLSPILKRDWTPSDSKDSADVNPDTQFLNASSEMLSIADPDGRFLQLNPRWSLVLGFSQAELKARPFIEFVHSEDQAETVEHLHSLRENDFPSYFENRCLCKDGSYRWLAWTAAPITGKKLLYLFARDITERKQSENEIRNLNRALASRACELERINRELEKEVNFRQQTEAALKEINSELEAFSYSVSHDLRAPLRAMQGFAEALLEDCGEELTEMGSEYASRIVAAANRMDVLVQDLLLYSRISYNDLPLESVDLAMVVTEATRQLEAPLRDLKAAISIRPPLPSVIGHYATIVQVLSNLLSNAIKFVSEGTQPTVQLWVEVVEDKAVLWMEDNGIGIDPAYHTRIFRAFERLHGSETYPGTGIGLAIVRKAVERMGGRVGLFSSPNHGSRFWVELLLDRARTPAHEIIDDVPQLSISSETALDRRASGDRDSVLEQERQRPKPNHPA